MRSHWWIEKLKKLPTLIYTTIIIPFMKFLVILT
jgi:hypothetical protein